MASRLEAELLLLEAELIPYGHERAVAETLTRAVALSQRANHSLNYSFSVLTPRSNSTTYGRIGRCKEGSRKSDRAS